MRKFLLIALGVIGVLGLLAAGIGAYLASRIDESQLRALLAQRLADGLGRPVTIAGALTLDLGMTPSVTVEQVSIGNASWGSSPTMLELRRVEAALELIPLLSKRVSVARLKVSGATALLETDANGRGNWQLGGEDSAAGGTRPWFYQVEADQVQITYRDGATGGSHRVEIERASAITDRRDGQVSLSLAGRLDGERVDLAGNLGPLDALLDPRGSALGLDLSGQALGVRATVKGGIREPNALRGVSLAVTLGGADTKLLGRVLDRPLPDLGPWRVAGRLEDRTGRLGLRGLEASVGDRAGVLLTAKGEVDDVLATQGGRRIRVDLQLRGADTAALSGPFGAAVPALGQFEASARLEETAGRFAMPRLEVGVGNGDPVSITVRGSVAEPLAAEGPRGIELDLAVEGLALDALSRVVGAPVPAVGAYRLSAHLSGSGRVWDLSKIVARVGGSDASGDARIDLAGARPRFEVRVESVQLDLMEWQKRAGAPAPPARGGGRVFGTAPLVPDWIGAFDLAARITAKELRTVDLFAQDVLVDLELKDRVLTLRPSNAQLLDGRASLEGGMDARANPPQLRAKLNARNLDAGRLSRALGATERLDGQLDLNLDLTGRGGTPRSLAASLNGKAAASLANGRVANRHIEWIAADLLRLLLPGGGEAETAINCAVGQFDIRAGVATAQALLVDTKRVVVTGGGTINLGNETLALRLDPKPKEPSLLSLAHPMLIGGTLQSPTVRPDPAGVAKGIGGAALGLAMGPLGLLLPFVSTGAGDANPCAKLLSGRR